MSTDSKARSGMMTFVVIIFAVALVIAGVYMIFFTPGQPDGEQPSPHAIEQRN